MSASGSRHTSARPVPPWPVLRAPAHWRRLDFISDLHLQADAGTTFQAWQDFMQTTRADAVFILGDLFDVWIGDDAMVAPGFEARCMQVLHDTSQRLAIYLMHGNRDFLLGDAFARAGGLTLLHDPSILDFAGQRWLLSHGDALCLGDTDYMRFRAQVRSAPWQRDFLDRPLAERQQMAQGMRRQSEARKRTGGPYADLDEPMTCHWLHLAHASTLIHGHTHRPADHPMAQGLRRIVLSDWDVSATPPRAQVLRLQSAVAGQAEGCTVQRLPVALAAD